MMTDATHIERTFRHVADYDVRARAFVNDRLKAGVAPLDILSEFVARFSATARTEADVILGGRRGLLVLHHLIVALVRNDLSYHTLTDRADFTAMLNSTLGSVDAESLNTMGQMMFQLAAHEVCGRRVFDVKAGLADKLKHTEVRGLTTDDLRLPFESIYVTAPTVAGLRVWNADTHWHDLEGVYVTEDFDQETGHRCWRFMAIGAPKPLTVGAVDFDNDALVYWRVQLPQGTDLQQAIELSTSHMREATAKFSTTFVEMLDEWESIFRYVMNVVLYATWPDADAADVILNREFRQLWQRASKAKGPKRGKLHKKLAGLNPRRRTVLGASIKLDRGAASEGSGADAGTGSPLAVLQRVRGHWRRVAHGSGRTERRLTWVSPYWRGPDDGPLGAHRHRLG